MPKAVLLVGCGKMGTALLRGWLANNAAPQFLVVEPAGAPAELAEATAISWHRSAAELPDSAQPEAIIFAVKPQVIYDVVSAYRRWVGPQTLFISIAAGVRIAGIAARLGEACLIRTMPNTPAAIGQGITVACANALVTPEQRRLCDRLLTAAGETAWVEDESLLDAVTAVSGSGPAYVFLLIEALEQAAQAAGLPPDLATRLARITVTGSAALARLSSATPAQLREDVTSPGGTTRAALDVLMAEDGLISLMRRAVAAAAARSRELAG